jgi:hypothetical protein
MPHDKLKAAIRARMIATGEPYSVARRRVIRQQAAGQKTGQPDPWFEISYSQAGIDRLTSVLDTLLGGGPGRSGVTVGPDTLRIQMADFRQAIPRGAVRSVRRSKANLRGTTGVHLSRGRLLVNGSADGLVEFQVDPSCLTSRTHATMFLRQRISSVVLSLTDADGFIAAVSAAVPGSG